MDFACAMEEGVLIADWSSCVEVEQMIEKVSGTWVFTSMWNPLAARCENLACGATIQEFVEWFHGVSERQVRGVLDYQAMRLKKALIT